MIALTFMESIFLTLINKPNLLIGKKWPQVRFEMDKLFSSYLQMPLKLD